MRDPKDEIDARVMEQLTRLRPAPERDPEKAAAGRLAFLQAAQAISAVAVSGRDGSRHSGWTQKIRSIISTNRKERSPMFTAIATFLTITALILGGGGVTVAAAQSSLPDHPLYGVKLWSEDLRATLTSDPVEQEQLSLNLLDKRFNEIISLLNEDLPISGAVNTEFQNRLEETIRLAVSLPEDQAVQKMLEIKTRLENQQQTLAKLQPNGGSDVEAAMIQTRDTIRSRLQTLEQSLPEALKQRDRTQDQIQDQTQERTQDQTQTQDQLQQMIQQATSKPEGTGPMDIPGAGKASGSLNDAGSPGGPAVEETPAPGENGQGLSNGPSATSTPMLLNNGSGNQNQGGQGPSSNPNPGNQSDPGGGGSGSPGGKR